ncbi:MAG TPA: hypothetical protein VNN55_03065 [bacterium]|nr:hypothetical protein [bacterium]
MSEIGDGNGSSYPGALDTNASLEYNAAVSSRTKARAEVVNDLAAAIIAIETTLGVNPQGAKSTVVSYLGQEHTTTGAHNDAYVVTTSGIQTITGQKTFAGGINVGASGIWGSSPGSYAPGQIRLSGDIPWFPNDVQVSGIVRTSGDIYFDGIINQGAIPWARLKRDHQQATLTSGGLTIPSGMTTIVSLSPMTVKAGDLILVWGETSFTVGATTTQIRVRIIKTAGDAVIASNDTDGGIDSTPQFVQSGISECALAGAFSVTTGGTVTLSLRASSAGADSTAINNGCGLRALVLRDSL